MKISYNWLKDYTNLTLSPVKAGEYLTDSGLEVEGIEEVQSVEGGLEGLVIGEVLTKEKHPNADKLSVTTVDIGSGDPLHIVCGAPNVATGLKVVVATVGAKLYPADGEPFKIKKGKIRGEVSEGMLCAAVEIGLGEDADGIMELDQDAVPGTAASEYFNLESDYCIEIGLTPNRADGFSHVGVARDLKALTAIHPEVEVPEVIWPGISYTESKENNTVAVDVEDTDGCKRYVGVALKNVKVGPSPEWMQNRLNTIGVRPINNVVDITNYVLHELGQPLHAFDRAQIKGDKVVVRPAKEGEKFVTLDGEERTLSSKDMMICDVENPMCIAGVFGGEKSGVSESTTDVFIESAYFNPVRVRKTAKAHGLNTDASFRFERGVDPNITVMAIERCIQLLQDIAGAELDSEISDYYPEPFENFTVEYNVTKGNQLIGVVIDDKEVETILNALDIEVTEKDGANWTLSVPPYRVDVTRFADVVEEVMRIYGYNNIPLPERMTSSISYANNPDPVKVRKTVASFLSGNGFAEVMHNSLTKKDYYIDNEFWPETELVEMQNPLSQELNVMRPNMLYTMLESMAYNMNRQQGDLKFYEFGKVYSRPKEDKFKESAKIAIAAAGGSVDENWHAKSETFDVFYLKGLINGLFETLGLNKFNISFGEFAQDEIAYGLSISINKNEVGYVGVVNAKTLKSFGIKNEVVFAELDWKGIMNWLERVKIEYVPVSKFPTVRRDLALLVKGSTAFSDIQTVAFKVDRKLLKEVNLFDVYKGKGLPEGMKSYAVSFTFMDDTKTLTDKQIDKIMDKMMNNLKNQLGAELR